MYTDPMVLIFTIQLFTSRQHSANVTYMTQAKS